MRWLFFILIALIALRLIRRFYIKPKRQAGPKKLTKPRNKSLYTISTFAKISVRRYFRDRVALFFTIAFPLIFLLVFGGLSKNDNGSFHVAVINQSHSQFANKFNNQLHHNKTFDIREDVTNLSQARERMSHSEIDATIVLPPGFGQAKQGRPSGKALIYYDQNNQSAAQTLTTVLQGIFDGINTQLIKIAPPFTVEAKSTNQKGLSRFDYTFAGLIGFSIMGLGIFGPVNYFPQLKKTGALRRLQVTPLRVWEYFLANVISNSIIGLFSIGIMFLVAVNFFNFKPVGNYLELAVFIVLGILSIFGIGLAVGGWAKNENQAAPLANIITFPMIFLSGTFFPRFLMPLWLQHVSAFLPLTPIIDGIRLVATEGKHLTALGPQLGLIAIWTVIIYAIAFRVFRWE
jgi:ABC-2 type transport system permease protein